MEINETDEYTLTIWFIGRPEKIWYTMPGSLVHGFEAAYTAFIQAESPKAAYIIDYDDRKRTVRLDLITDYSVILNS